MTDRDHFAAAALSGLIASEGAEAYLMQAWCYRAFAWADAMLRERDVVRDSRTADMANHDAAPAARARTNAAGISRQGTGETPVSYEKTDEKRGNSPAIRDTTRPRNGALQPALTDAEREAIAGAIDAELSRGAWKWADTLCGLLERLK